MKTKLSLVITAVVILAVTAGARAELIYGIGGTGESATAPVLFKFDSSAPGTITTVGSITGITAGQTLEKIAFAPNGTLYALGYVETAGATQGDAQLYAINLNNGAATAVNASPVNLGFSQGGASAVSLGFAFASANAIQVMDAGGGLFQLNPANGAVIGGSISSVDYSSAPTPNNVPQWSGLAIGSNGRLYTIDETNNQLGIRQTANPAKIDLVGTGFGISARGPRTMGFAISAGAGNAYLQTDTDDAEVQDSLYLLNTTSGAASLVGPIGSNTNFNTTDIAISPTAILSPTVVVSRKTHGAAGDFDIPLPLTGNPGIECRSGGAGGNHLLVVTFASPVTTGPVSLTSGTGSVSNASVNGNTVSINLSGVSNAQTIQVTLSNVSNGSLTNNVVVPMAVLLGDTNANGAVNSTDVSQTKLQSGVAANTGNFRTDVNANGVVNSTDVSTVKLQSGTALP